MRILVLSDTHGNYPLALRAIESCDSIDHVVHLGDLLNDAYILEQITEREVIKVAGNCDLANDFARESSINIAGTHIFLTHGDRFQVKSGLSLLYKKALLERAQVVLYGHSHKAAITNIKGVLFVNPGCMNRESTNHSYAILTINRSGTVAEIIPLEN